MIIGTGPFYFEANESKTFKLTPERRFQANAVSMSNQIKHYFFIAQCKFGDHEIIRGSHGAVDSETFCELFPYLDVSERTCLEGKEIELTVMNVIPAGQTFCLSFAGWDG